MGTNTGIGIGIGIPFKNFSSGGRQPLPPDLKASLKGVWIAYGKSNNDADRSIVKNLVDLDNPFIISNAAFKLNSGFGGFVEDFTSWDRIDSSTAEISNDGSKIKCINTTLNVQYLFNYINRDISSFKVKISNFTKGDITYYYRKEDGIEAFFKITPLSVVNSDKVIELPKSYNTVENGTGSRGGFYSSNINIGVTIEQIPSFEGAFVTDGIDDLITSTKTVQEMLGGSNEITVVSMMANLDSSQIMCNSNFSNTNGYNVRNTLEPNGVISMLGYTDKNGTTNNLNLIMGDKNSIELVDKVNFNSDYVFHPSSYNVYCFKTAWYWTIIANKVLTTDQINQVIAYFNLDRTLKPDILCNITKQGITNDNHADFNDKLIDYSGNGRDIQMNNLAWKGGSGIAAKPFETIKDYTILSDEARQELTIYNEFSYKVKSNTPNHYWVVQSIIKDNTSYQVTIITDKDCYWINSTSFTNNEGNKESIRKEYPVKANTPTQVIICGLNEFEYPEGIEPTTAVSYVNLEYAGEITVTFIPSHKGGLLLDGVNDFGKVTGLPIYKDYTVIADYIRISAKENAQNSPILSKSKVIGSGTFLFNYLNADSVTSSFSFGTHNALKEINDFERKIYYLSKYASDGYNVNAGSAVDYDTMWLGAYRDNAQNFFNGAIYSLMSFPYSMSEFLIERQLKKHKLGTLYPNMVEFRPVIKANANYNIFYTALLPLTGIVWEKINIGDYIPVGRRVAIQLSFDNEASELVSAISSQLGNISITKNSNNKGYTIFGDILKNKSPQKINITIDEYIRFEDIVQPYPVLLRFNDENGNEVSWGGKFKVGSTITRIGSAADSNLLPNIYNIFGLLLNGNQVTSSKVIVEKTMVFKAKSAYIFDNNEPKCILSPRLLRIPNSSYKILGYIPDISGHGNHGKINNSAYAEGSGVNEDGSYQFDGVDDFVTIPTTVGGKQVLMKVNWDSPNASILYDQRGYNNEFAIYNGTNDSDGNPIPAYQGRNNGQTYIDGILNSNIKASELRAITHNITITNELSSGANKTYPIIGSSKSNAYFVNMALYDFMLFDKISTDDKILELNEYVGIEAKVELPPYYWDAYGKTNLDGDKATIQQRGVAVGDFDLTNNNLAYEGMSGYNGYPVVFGANKTWANESNGYVTSITSNTIHITNVLNAGLALLYSHVKYNGNLQNIKEIPPFKIEIKGLEGRSKFIYKYLATSDATKETNLYLGNGTHELPKSFLPTEALINNAVVGFSISPIEEGVTNFLSDITIEVLPEYENGLAYDGVSDFTNNKNIPILTDFTFIIKREILGLETNEQMLVIKGDKVYNNGIGNAFILEHNNNNGVNYVYSYGKLNQIKRDDSKIIYLTPESYNGNPIIKGENGDNLGLVLSRHWRGIIYKTILYSKTISLLQINFLKNLMEKDEIIDLNNPIFIKNE